MNQAELIASSSDQPEPAQPYRALPSQSGSVPTAADPTSALVEQCRLGDAQAWAALVHYHHGLVYSLCYQFTRSVADAEDLTQEVFIKIYANLPSFDACKGDLGGWITAVTRNLLVDHFRRTRTQRATDSLDAGWDEKGAQPHSHHLPDKGATPHQRAVARETGTILRRAIGHLSPEMREAVSLRYFRGMEYKTIAQFLKIPEGTVKSRINRSHAELARRLGTGYASLSYV